MDKEWWRGAVIYQVYPRSYKDTSGNGVGDLPGITEKLDYIAGLGVEGVWISPFFKSPMKDYGYDVADYRDVDPVFGSLEDFKTLLNKAHKLGLKIIIDMVLSHTSDMHAWFQESRQNRDNPKADWYVWADPKTDGSPPNNWLAHFGGPSWTYEVRRGQYYLHNFLKEQPDLNLHNSDVQAALFEEMKFWLDMGVDGFRLDAVGCYFHDPELKDNPSNPYPAPAFFNINFPTPHSMQIHANDYLIEPGVEFCKKIRALTDQYNDRMIVAEVGGEDCLTRSIDYTNGSDLLHTAYNFGLLGHTCASANHIAGILKTYESKAEESWPSWAFCNHDVVRVVTRWRGENAKNPAFAKVLFALLASLRGTTFVYQGEELGLPEARLSYEDLHDPWGKYLYPQWQGRDGCRTPMPWNKNQPHGGFGSIQPWLPVPEAHLSLAVDQQEQDRNSMLHFTRSLLHWRKTQPTLVHGDIEFIYPNSDDNRDTVIGFIRRDKDKEILCLFNLSDEPQEVTVPEGVKDRSLFDAGTLNGTKTDTQTVVLPAFGMYFSG